MAQFNYARMIAKADQLIAKFGQPTPAALRRDGDTANPVDRPCTAVLIEYRPYEKGLRLAGAVRFIISTIDPETRQQLLLAPDHEQDMIVFSGNVYRIVSPDEGPRPGGVVLFHDLQAVHDGLDLQTS